MPIDATLTETEKNDVLQAVIKYKFNPADFKWVETILKESKAFRGVRVGETEFTASKLIHIPTQYYMTFGGYTITWSPGITRKVDQEGHEDLWLRRFLA
jgi:hypothetical protein